MKTYLVAIVASAITMAAPVSAAPGGIDASMDEAHIATKLSEKVGFFQYCGTERELGDLPAKLKAFTNSHLNGRYQPLSSDMGLAVMMNTMAYVSKAGGKQNFCAGLAQIKPKAVTSIQDDWAKLQKAHGEAKSKGH